MNQMFFIVQWIFIYNKHFNYGKNIIRILDRIWTIFKTNF